MSVIEKMIGGPSLYELLSEHREPTSECVERVKPMLEAAQANDANNLKSLAEEVFEIEQAADQVKNEIRDNLPRTKWMSVSRYDFLAFLKEQDSIADCVEDVAMMLRLKPLRMPDQCDGLPCMDELTALADNAVQAAEKALELSKRFCDGRGKGFGSDVAEVLKEGGDKIGAFEFETDKNQFRLLRAMLNDDPDNVSFGERYVAMEVVRNLGRLANHAEGMTDFLRLMVAE